jgi:Aldehyde oxidase and xanthine dehydrogenase, a/b hammerhead domain/Uncharacterised protein family (UPF0149)
MTTYIGTATSRVDGHAKVTGAAKYAGEFNMPGLAHASVVTSPIAKGRIARIDASEALSVEGVLDVLTHQHRPAMASADSDYKDDVAPEGSPYRPLYDDRILFSGQPLALVVAEEPEVARCAGEDRVRPDQGERAGRAAAVAVEGSPGNPAGCRVSRPARRRRPHAAQAMSLEQLERWIERLEPSPRIDGVSMLDGYLTAIIVGPCSIDPNEWMRHVLGPHSAIGMEGSEQLAAMQAIAARFNAIGESLATAPRDYAPIFERTDDGVVDAGSVQKVGGHAAFASCGSGVETSSKRWPKPEPSKPL